MMPREKRAEEKNGRTSEKMRNQVKRKMVWMKNTFFLSSFFPPEGVPVFLSQSGHFLQVNVSTRRKIPALTVVLKQGLLFEVTSKASS